MMYGSYFILIRALLRPHNTSEILPGNYSHPASPSQGEEMAAPSPVKGRVWMG